MKIVFMGTPEFAVPTLESLILNHQVEAVFTQPDRPKGRGKKLAFSAVKEVAVKHGIKIYQPEKLKNDRECIEALKAINPDFIVVVAYGQILSQEILDIPKYYCINLHASLLPKYRGAAPIQWCIINGETESGNTTMKMDAGIDTGDILMQSKVAIDPDLTADELHDKLMEDGGKLVVDTIQAVVENKLTPVPQVDELSCNSPMLSREKAKIDWKASAKDIHNLVRGLNSWPVAHTNYNELSLKVFKTAVVNIETNKTPGSILKVDNKGILVATGEKALLIEEIQFPNGKRMKVSDYIRGNNIEEGLILD
ncbi:methionyl-tRNA formyltransferase [Clostridium oryzae]|uniref:Methionyl-tRNA formyltransferase n=1 Tax=Clostridium oryzae TaxID=1450648 RepID=A0A1V4IPB0_9CLOT|nr:methionyl-tRNA formyltransferase [Clostridium oryzae]OPJ61756.1 methionyl-tRNA formyltransferase [Clostridium oryzae]